MSIRQLLRKAFPQGTGWDIAFLSQSHIHRFNLYQYRRQTKKWLIRFALAFLAALVGAGVSIALTGNGIWGIANGKEPIPNSQSPIPNSQQLLEQGIKFFQAEQFSQAAEVWQQAAAAFKASGDRLGEAQALSHLSLAYQQLGKLAEAQDAIASSLSLIRNSNNNSESGIILAQALNAQGHLQLALGESEAALKTWQQAATTYSQIGDKEGAIGCQINEAQALQNLGLYRRARKILEEVEVSLQTQPNSLVKATGLRSLANSLRAIGELEKSRQLLQESLIVAQELRSPAAISAAQFSLGNTNRALANRAKYLENTASAKTEVQAAISAYQQAAETSNSPIMRVQAQVNQLSLLVEERQFSEAENLRSQIHLEQLPVSRRSVFARINFAQSLAKLGNGESEINNRDLQQTLQLPLANNQEIAQILAKAVQEARSIKDTRAESFALGNLGALYELAHQAKEAENLTQQALVLAQAINAADVYYRWQWQLGRLLKTQGDEKGAIAAYNVAVETLESLRSDLVAINADNSDIQFSFRDSVEPVYREFVDLLVSTKSEQRQDKLRQARYAIEALQLAELDNFFQEACINAKPVQIDRVDTSAAVIYPIILKDKLAVIFALPESGLRLYTTLKPESEIASILDELQQDIGRIAANNEQVLRLSQQVYDWIIRPAEAELEKNKVQTLVFVPDGLLRNIPMAALHDGKQYLIEKYSIALTPGLQLLAPQPLRREQFRVLTAGLSEARQGFPALPNVRPELEQIKSQVNSQVLLDKEFTDNNLQQALNVLPFPIVHIATHGQFSSQAEKTFILTWNDKINVKDLDILLRRKQQKFSRPIELLVFSACETADGDNRAALGLAGVAVKAGARSTLATLWRVSDDSTAALMVKFYNELAKSGITKAEALRQAQVQLLQSKRYKFPYFWAPYVLVGNWR
ncbi:CHAT domain-containing protein [Aerosakkonema funiforme]|uniref:CHAT domain-containing protein n=1 Tax=Aerosakkonema funiforme FACHB-1375 TaxID=2949571 RepID=A0A926VD08_9CYAN|nr:CHAT domain-containing protein [Aerosakkonema funiforme]MBD2181465.1 CHAT domain-containing protein [Aerosakkonema funiforme FACHB-1375]